MKVRVTCQSCFQPFMVAEEKLGKKVRCSQCNEVTIASASGRSGGKSSGGNGVPVPVVVGGGVALVVVAAVAVLALRANPVPVNPAPAVAATPSPATAGSAVPIVASSGGTSPVPVTSTPASTSTSAGSTPAATTPVAETTAMASGSTTPPAHTQSAPAATSPTPMPAPAGEAGSGGNAAVADAAPGSAAAGGSAATGGSAEKSAVASTSGTPAATGSAGGDASTDAKARIRKSDFDLPSITKLELPELIKRVEPSVVVITTSGKDGGGQGSGFVIDKEGTVVTNVHVIQGASKATVRLADGTKGEVTGVKLLIPTKDIAIVTVNLPVDKLHPLPVSKLIPDKGISTAAFGAPIGLSFTASEGIISSIRKADELDSSTKTEGMWLQTTSPISPGNSGGPLVDMFGSVVGMNTMQYSVGQNLNFAISSKDIYEAMDAAPEKSKPLDAVPELQEKPSIAQQRLAAKNEIGTARGARLFANVTEIFPINMARYRAVILDPTGNIWGRIVQRSESIVEKCGIDLSFVDDPSDDASVMLVHLDLRRSRKGGTNSGTQELFVRAELIVFDQEAERRVDKLNVVWKNEMSLGTISAQALATGNFPRGANENLTKFFATFQTAYQKAQRDAKKAEEEKSGEKSDEKSGDKSGDKSGEKSSGDDKSSADTKPEVKQDS